MQWISASSGGRGIRIVMMEVIGQQGCKTDEVVMFVVCSPGVMVAAARLYELGSDSGGKVVVLMVARR